MNVSDIKKVACVGSGTIGSSFAAHFALKGYPVNVYDVNDAMLEKGKENVKAVLDSLREENVITEAQETDILGRVTYTTDPSTAFSDVQFIQENGPEKLGFIANRLAHALWREEVAIVSEGVCTLEDCDNALLFGPGLRYAIFGPGMIYELGSAVGLKGTVDMFSTMSEMVFADLSNATHYPEGFADLVDAQIKDEIRNLPDFKGKTHEEQAQWRDHILVELLKLHGKL